MMIVTVRIKKRPITGSWKAKDKSVIYEAANNGIEYLAAVISSVPGPAGPLFDIDTLPLAP